MLALFLLLPLLAQTSDAKDEPIPALGNLDPVELCRGKEVAGDPTLTTERWLYRYAFANEANRRAFQAAPETYEIQLGGACGRMGAGSGRGSPERWWVHEGRIYLFASDMCRATFQKDPAVFLDPDEAPVEGSAEALARGKELVETAVKAHGGAERIDGLKLLDLQTNWTEEQGGQSVKREQKWTFRFPDDVRIEDAHDDWRWTTVLRKDDAFEGSRDDNIETLHATARREHERRLAREPLVILRARTRPDFRAASLGKHTVDGRELERVAVSFAGTRTELGLEVATGRMVEVAYRGRGPRLAFGAVRRDYGDMHDLGLVVPKLRKESFDGKQVAERRFSWYVSSDLGDPRLFERPGKR